VKVRRWFAGIAAGIVAMASGVVVVGASQAATAVGGTVVAGFLLIYAGDQFCGMVEQAGPDSYVNIGPGGCPGD